MTKQEILGYDKDGNEVYNFHRIVSITDYANRVKLEWRTGGLKTKKAKVLTAIERKLDVLSGPANDVITKQKNELLNLKNFVEVA